MMAPKETIDRKNVLKDAIPAPTPSTFVRAASLANLFVATLVFIEFGAIALVNHDSGAFYMVFWLIPLVTLVIWGTAAVLCVVHLASKRVGTLARRLSGSVGASPSVRSGVWDGWLDSPEPRHP
jgi:hypothetical protein